MRAAFVTALVALTACGAEAQQEAAAPPPRAAGPAAAQSPACQTAGGEPIPSEYHGEWDADQGDCSPASPSRVTIRIDGVTFHDGRRHAISAACTTDAPVLSLYRKGDRLVMTHAADSASPAETLKLKPCPA